MHGESLFFINKSCVHSFDKRGDYEGLALIFTDDFFCKTDADRYFLRNAQLFNNPNLFSTISLDREFSFFYDNILRIKDELKMPTDSFQFEILHNTLHNILLRAERLAIQQNTQDIKKGADYEYTSLFRDLVENQYTKKKSVGEYASQLFISEKRLGQATTKILGMNPKEFINERIMLEAKRLLVHSNRSIKEIGIELGFDDPAYFFRYFRKYSESTPIEFREKYLNT